MSPHAESLSTGGEALDVGGDVELFSWWTSGGEREALESLFLVHKERVPDAEVTNAAVAFADKAREQLGVRFSEGLPPDLFQANSGADLMTWVVTNGHNDENAIVEDITDLWEALEWNSAFPEEVVDSVSFQGRKYGVPVNVHRINSLFYRTELFEKYDLEVPDSAEALIDFCDGVSKNADLQAESPTGRMSCLALGNKWDWTLSLLTFEMVLPAVAGPEFYVSYFSGGERALDPMVKKSLDIVLSLYCGGAARTSCLKTTWFNPDINELTWDEGVRKLAEGSALMAPMGDWAKGFLESENGGGLRAGENFKVAPFPGTEGTYVFTTDTFTLPRAAANRDGARSFLKTVGSGEGQLAFNLKKGSIPARNDVSLVGFDEMQQETMHDFEHAVRVRALSGLLSTPARTPLHPELSASIRAETTSIIERYLEVRYPLK